MERGKREYYPRLNLPDPWHSLGPPLGSQLLVYTRLAVRCQGCGSDWEEIIVGAGASGRR